MRFFYIITVSLFTALGLRAETIPPAVRLAIISESSDVATAVDVLAAEFSKNEKLQLLERGQIEKIYREQALSAGGKDFLKLGQLLGADGLLVLEKDADAANPFLRVQLVAVQPGVLLSSERFGWPLKELPAWAAALARHLNPLWPKLGVRSADAIPISIVNLRSPIQSSAARETERQLTLLTIERLSREPQLFVLERRRMQWLAAEKTLKTLDDSAFWNGSCLLDGTLDNAGFSPDTITISARLVPPQGGAPVKIEVSGSRTNLGEVVNRLAEKILENLKLGGSRAPWNAADEAEQFFAEAQWALKWNLFPQAQAAAESAWALGKKNSESAQLLIRSYADSVPDNWLNTESDIKVEAVPAADEFAPLLRGLEFFSQNAPLVYAGSDPTNVPAFTLGQNLLWRAAGLLESYYYAAEARVGHEEQLSSLREKMRATRTVMDAHPVPDGRRLFVAGRPRLDFVKLKWAEGGAWFERPEDALNFYRDQLQSGAHPETLPRVIGWSWADRKRVPALLRKFVNEVCADTNPAVRLEGFYFALLLAPDDEQGSLRRGEEELETAMWENREALFRTAGSASLTQRLRATLIKKYDYEDFYHLFVHEPFSSFHQRLRLDYLEHAVDTNFAVLQSLFPNTSDKMETPEQARELVAGMERMQQRLAWEKLLDWKLRDLRRTAGLPITGNEPKPKPVIPAGEVLEAKFIKWNLSSANLGSGRLPRFFGMILRNGKLWMRVNYYEKDRSFSNTEATSYLCVDPRSGVREEISFPEKIGVPGGLFEVTSNELFVEAGGHLYEYGFQKKSWAEISVPMEGSSQLVWLKDRLFIGRNDGLLALSPDSKKVELLVSSRRTPAVNEIDPLWTGSTRIFPQADGRLGALNEDHGFIFDPNTSAWKLRALPLTGTNRYFSMTAAYTAPGGAEWLLTGPLDHRYLVGFGNDDGPAESLLMEETGIGVKSPPQEKLLQPVRWDWPQKYPMEHGCIVGDGKKLWVLSPRKTWLGMFGQEPVTYSDNRQATLFGFEPEFRTPLSVAIHFEEIELPKINGMPTDMLAPMTGGGMDIWERLRNHNGNWAFWLPTPEGLVFGAPNYSGHWLIPSAAVESRLQPQREALRKK